MADDAKTGDATGDEVAPPVQENAKEEVDVMKQQEAMLKAKYPGLGRGKKGPGRRLLGGKERHFYDSADHFSGQETGTQPATINNIRGHHEASDGKGER